MKVLRPRYLVLQLSLWVCGILCTFVSSEYLRFGRFSTTLSFYSPDPPGNIPTTCKPQPLGLHYFGDFVSIVCHAQFASPYNSGFISNYFPFSYVMMSPFGPLMRLHVLAALLPFIIASSLLICIPIIKSMSYVSKAERYLTVLIAVVMTYPFISFIDRGNAQGFVTGFLVTGIYLYMNSRFNESAIFLGLATALKGYPIIFLIIFVRKRQWRPLAISILTGGIATIIPLLFFDGGMIRNIQGLMSRISGLQDSSFQFNAYNNSLKGLLFSIQELKISPLTGVSHLLTDNYSMVAALIAGIIIIAALTLKFDLLEFSILASIFCCLLIDLTAGYVLTTFFVPVMIFLSGKYEISPRRSFWYMAGIAIILAPKGIPIKITPYWPEATYSPSFNSVLSPLMQLGLIVSIVISHICSKLKMSPTA